MKRALLVNENHKKKTEKLKRLSAEALPMNAAGEMMPAKRMDVPGFVESVQELTRRQAMVWTTGAYGSKLSVFAGQEVFLLDAATPVGEQKVYSGRSLFTIVDESIVQYRLTRDGTFVKNVLETMPSWGLREVGGRVVASRSNWPAQGQTMLKSFEDGLPIAEQSWVVPNASVRDVQAGDDGYRVLCSDGQVYELPFE